MSKNTAMNIRMDESTRRELNNFASELGVPANSLVNATIKQMLRTRSVTFSTLEPTPYLEKIIKEAEADYKAGKNISGPFETAEELIAELEK